MQEISRQSLAEEVATRLRAQILDGALPPGQRLNEAHLAAALGVSRTPLREGLIRLASEGLVDRVAGRGFGVRSMDASELRELYPIRACLEVLALRLAGSPSERTLAELRAANWELAQDARPATRVGRDEAFHRGLLAHCPNRCLLELLADLTARCRRYEHRFVEGGARARDAAAQHAEILRALESGDLETACTGLEANLVDGVEAMASWVESGR
jgi:DNA-binding GntR family transcriptional regulator